MNLMDAVMTVLHSAILLLLGILAYLFKEIRADTRWTRDKVLIMWETYRKKNHKENGEPTD